MTIAERLTPLVELPFEGKRWRILFTHDLLLKLEAATGLDILAGKLNIIRPPAKILRTLLHEILLYAGADCSLKQAGDIMHPNTILGVRAILVRAWEVSMPDPEKEEEQDGETEAGEKQKSSLPSWTEAWAMAHEDLRLSDREWLDLTPRLLQALLRQRLENLRQWELMCGMIIANNANYSYAGPKEPLRAQSFMLHPWNKSKQEDQVITGEYLMKHFAQFKNQKG